MPSPANYADSVRTLASPITGGPATKTGEYYSHIYSGTDVDTGVPVVGVELHTQKEASPVPLDSVSNAQALDIVLTKQPKTQTPARQVNSVTIQTPATSTPANSIISDGGALPLGGIIIFILLLGAAWLVYTIVRIWQNNQAHRAIIRASSTTNTMPIVELPTESAIPVAEPDKPQPGPVESTTFNIDSIETDLEGNSVESWRNAFTALDTQLLKLLTSKGIEGETISDKLKAVSAGEFASVDIAWEAHQTAKNLLAMHDDQLKTQDLTRGLKLFRQVFADHGVI